MSFTLLCVVWTAWRCWRIIPLSPSGKTLLTLLLFLVPFVMLILLHTVSEKATLPIAAAFYEIGNSWMIFALYSFMLFALLSLGRLFRIVPSSFLSGSLAGTCTVFGLLTLILAYGNIHYRHKYRVAVDLKTEKKLERPLTAVLISDLHAGYHNRNRELERWVDMINAEKADLVLVAGDIIDGDVRPLRGWNYAEIFRKIKAPVYACLGNHEYYAGKEDSEVFYRDAGIHLLEDDSVLVGGIRIVGRDDRTNPERKPLEELVPADSLFTVVLDHQPFNLEEAVQAEVDFQFSGHTHHGQVWPGNWITDAIFEKAAGTLEKGKTFFYVSSGLGIWGGKFRIGTRSEYAVLTLHN